MVWKINLILNLSEVIDNVYPPLTLLTCRYNYITLKTEMYRTCWKTHKHYQRIFFIFHTIKRLFIIVWTKKPNRTSKRTKKRVTPLMVNVILQHLRSICILSVVLLCPRIVYTHVIYYPLLRPIAPQCFHCVILAYPWLQKILS